MKYSVAFLVFFALCAVAFSANVDHHAKAKSIDRGQVDHAKAKSINHPGHKVRKAAPHGARKALAPHMQVKSVEKHPSAGFNSESVKNAIDTGASCLTSAVDRIAPLAKTGVALGGELVQRIMQGPGKEGRALDNKLVKKLENYGNDVRSAAYDAFAAAKEVAKAAGYTALFERLANAFAFAKAPAKDSSFAAAV